MSQPKNPRKQVECPQCAKMFKRVCDMAKHHDNLHLDAKLVLVPEGEPSARNKNMLKNLKDWPGRTAIIDSNKNGRAVVRVMMSSDAIGPRPRDPTVDLSPKTMCPDCGFKAASFSSYNRHRLIHHRTSKGGKGKKGSEKASTPLGRVDAASGTSAASVAVSAAEAEPASFITVFSAGAPMQPAVSGTCRNCGQRGHYVRDCKKPSRMPGNRSMMGGSGKSNLRCRNCRQDGHIAKSCPLPQQQRDMVRQAEDGARRLEELYARVVETQRNLTFLQQQAQLGIPASRPGNMMGNMSWNMGGNMPGASYGMGGGFSGASQGTPYGMGSQMGMNMRMPFGNAPQLQGQNWYRDT